MQIETSAAPAARAGVPGAVQARVTNTTDFHHMAAVPPKVNSLGWEAPTATPKGPDVQQGAQGHGLTVAGAGAESAGTKVSGEPTGMLGNFFMLAR